MSPEYLFTSCPKGLRICHTKPLSAREPSEVLEFGELLRYKNTNQNDTIKMIPFEQCGNTVLQLYYCGSFMYVLKHIYEDSFCTVT